MYGFLTRPRSELPHLTSDGVFPTIKGPGVGKSNLKTAAVLESLTLDVYVRLGQVLSLWKSAAHDSLAHSNSSDISPGVKQGDWILLNRRTCERNINTHSVGPIIQTRFKVVLRGGNISGLSGDLVLISHDVYCAVHVAVRRAADALKAGWESVRGYTSVLSPHVATDQWRKTRMAIKPQWF